jgi:polyisoprenoid-binding protein YceI
VLFVLDRTIFAPAAISTALPVAPTIAAPAQSAPTTAAPTQPAPTQAAQSSDPATSVPQPTTAASSAPAAADGATLYRIDATQSEVRYEVNETFFQGNRLNTAIGRTKGVAGDILINTTDPAKSQIGEIVIDISQFTSDESRRDNFIRNNGLQSAKYPQATFKTTSISGLPAKVNVGDEVSFTITGDLTVKETTKPVTWQVSLKNNDQTISGTATTQILMSDFGVGPLQLPMLATEDNVKLTFDFVAAKVQ